MGCTSSGEVKLQCYPLGEPTLCWLHKHEDERVVDISFPDKRYNAQLRFLRFYTYRSNPMCIMIAYSRDPVHENCLAYRFTEGNTKFKDTKQFLTKHLPLGN